MENPIEIFPYEENSFIEETPIPITPIPITPEIGRKLGFRKDLVSRRKIERNMVERLPKVNKESICPQSAKGNHLTYGHITNEVIWERLTIVETRARIDFSKLLK